MLLVVKVSNSNELKIYRLDNRLKHLRKYQWLEKGNGFPNITCTAYKKENENFEFHPAAGTSLIKNIMSDRDVTGESKFEFKNGNQNDLRRSNLKWIS